MSDFTPAISVIVPVYRVEPYLHRCIDSILAQTFTDFELILVDDGSPDNCGAMCDEYAVEDSRIIVVHKLNGGQGEARNFGIDIAKGKYFCFVDSDDFVSENCLSLLFSNLTKYNADISTCGYTSFFHASDSPNQLVAVKNIIETTGEEECRRIFACEDAVNLAPWCKLFKKELFAEIRFPNGRVYEDLAIIPTVIYNAKKIVISDSEEYYYLIRSTGTTNGKFSERNFEEVEACDLFLIPYFKDKDLFNHLIHFRNVVLAKNIIRAIEADSADLIPEHYRISQLKAFANLYYHSQYKTFSWYLAKLHPNLTWIFEYDRRAKKLFGLPCRQ